MEQYKKSPLTPKIPLFPPFSKGDAGGFSPFPKGRTTFSKDEQRKVFQIKTLLILVIVCMGCATTGMKTVGEEKLIWSSHEKRPEWLSKVPVKKKNNLFFVGFSEKHALEKHARDSALRHATNKVVGYIGTDVKSKFEKIQTSYGLSSDIINPTVFSRQLEEQLLKGFIQRVKAKEWYIEKFQKQDKDNSEIGWKVCVLAFVPEKEVNKVIKEQTKQREELAKFVKAFRKVFEVALKNVDFNIKIWMDKGTNAVYTEGEKMTIYFQADKDCYVYLYYKNAENNITQLFPNSYNRDNSVKANKEYSIPDETMKFKFTIKKPFGVEAVKAIASIQPLKELELFAENEIFPQLGKIDNRKVLDVVRIISNIPEKSRAENIAIITTVAK